MTYGLGIREYYYGKMSQKDIFSLVFGNIDFDKYVTNPLREDTNPGAWFEEIDGILYFRDFAYGQKKLDAIDFLMEYLKLDNEQDLMFYLDGVMKIEKAKVIKGNKRIIRNTGKNREAFIFFKPDKWRKKDQKYWDQFKITLKYLTSDYNKVYPTEDVIINKGKPYKLELHSRCYAITWDKCTKIYCPFANKKRRFFTDCNQNFLFGKPDFSKDTIIITKSYKDRAVLKNLQLNTVGFQNEGMMPNYDKLQFLSKFKRIIVFFDNDGAGITASKKVRDDLRAFLEKDVKSYHLPKNLLLEGISDPADYVRVYNYKLLKNKLKNDWRYS